MGQSHQIELPEARSLQQVAEQLILTIRMFKGKEAKEPFAQQEFTDDQGDRYVMRVTRLNT